MTSSISQPARSRRQLRTALLFVGPWFIGFCTLQLYPFFASLYWSGCDWDLINSPRWVGGRNYRRLADELFNNGLFGQAVANTVYYAAISVPCSIVLGVALGVMLSWKVRGQAFYRTLFFLPSVVPVVAASALWMWLLDPQSGLVNEVLTKVGLPAQNWLNSTSMAAWPASWPQGATSASASAAIFGSKDSLVLMSLWGVGNFMIIYLAALGDVPRELYEAAEIEGAGLLRRFRHVTLPLLTPVIFFNLVMGVIQSVQAFTQIYVVSQGKGEPAGSTLMLSLHLFLSAFRHLDVGYASAMAWVMFVAVAAVTWLLFRSSRHWVHYSFDS